MNIAGAHAVVTGGGTGIGAAIAEALAGEGAQVTLMGRRREPLEAVAARIGEMASVVTCDVTDAAQVEAAFSSARERNGPVDILIANAGAASTAPFRKLDFAEWRAIMAVNADAVFLSCKAVIDEMLAAGQGRIVTVASIAGLGGVPLASAYSAAKHAAVGLTRSIAIELAGKGVTANAICPGFVATDMFERSVATIQEKTGRSREEAVAELAQLNRSGRVITVDEVAAATLDLIRSDRNGEALEIA